MDMTVLLITAGAGIIIGLLIGLMINSLRGDTSKRTIPPESNSRGIDNVLLWHDQEGGNLIVDLDGATFTRVADMRADQRSRLETIYSQLKRFMGVQDTTPRPVQVAAVQVERPPQTPFTESAGQPVPARSIPVPPAPAQSGYSQATPVQSPTAEFVPGKPISTAPGPETIIIQAATEDKKGAKKPLPEPIKPLNIVGEIDEILQDMIAGTPLFERGLELVETPAHTIAVWIDSHQFESIDAVTDPAVQQIIRAAVKKWENKPR